MDLDGMGGNPGLFVQKLVHKRQNGRGGWAQESLLDCPTTIH